MNTNELLNLILKAEEETDMRVFGFRSDDRVFAVGDELPYSYRWSDDEDLDGEELDGTCATGIFFWVEEDEESIIKALNLHKRINYTGKHLYLIGGESSDYGEDPGEVIISNFMSGARCVAVLS